MTPADIYKSIFAGSTATVKVATKKEYNTLRMALARQHREYELFDLTQLALISSYNKEAGQASFHLGQRQNAAKEYTVTLSTDDSPDGNCAGGRMDGSESAESRGNTDSYQHGIEDQVEYAIRAETPR